MQRNRESKYRQKLINCLHKNKSQQKDLEKIVWKYGVTYCDMYLVAVKHDYSQSRDIIRKMVDQEMEETFRSFGDVSELPLDLFITTNCLGRNNRPYYLGVDFARGNDWTGEIVLNGGGKLIGFKIRERKYTKRNDT